MDFLKRSISVMSHSDEQIRQPREGEYEARERFTLAEAPGLRIRVLSLGIGQCVPWHYHNEITDTFFCMEGPMCVRTREPDAEYILNPGGTMAIPPGRPHYAAGDQGQACKFLVVQGVGTYDYVAVED